MKTIEIDNELLYFINPKFKYFFLIEGDQVFKEIIKKEKKQVSQTSKEMIIKLNSITLDYIKKLIKEKPLYVLNKYINYYFKESDIYKNFAQNLKKMEQFIMKNNIILEVEDYFKLLENDLLRDCIWYLYYSDNLKENESYNFDKSFINALIHAYLIRQDFEVQNKKLSSNDIDIFDIYVNELKKFPLLTKNEERLLITRARNGDKIAKDYFLNCNLKLVISIAKKMINKGVYLDLNDLIQEGSLGLITAYEKFDLSKNYKFSTYAYIWIHQYMSNFIYKFSNIISSSKSFTYNLKRIRNVETRYLKNYDRLPTLEEIAKDTGLSIKKIKELKKYNYTFISIENNLSPNFDLTIEEVIPSGEDIEMDFINKSLVEQVKKFIENHKLDKYQSEILMDRYGFSDGQVKSLSEIGDKYGKTRQAINMSEKALLNELRNQEGVEELADYALNEEKALANLQRLKKEYSEKQKLKKEKEKERRKEKRTKKKV